MPSRHTSVAAAICAALVLASCGAQSTVSHVEHDQTSLPASVQLGHLAIAPAKGDKTLTVSDVSTSKEVAFVIRDGETVMRDYGIRHEMPMHLFAVRDDLSGFTHLHPELSARGEWRVSFAPAKKGTYWFYADFADASGKTYTLRFARKYEGERGEYGFRPDVFDTEKTVRGVTTVLATSMTADGTVFHYNLLDASGRAVDPETYLGAAGHSVLIGQRGEFAHLHPLPASAGVAGDRSPQFFLHGAPTGTYRIFTQFKVKGAVLTWEFDWQA